MSTRIVFHVLAWCIVAPAQADDVQPDFAGTYTLHDRNGPGASIQVRPLRAGETLDIVPEEMFKDKTRAIAWVGQYRTMSEDGLTWRAVTPEDKLPVLALADLTPDDYEKMHLDGFRTRFGVTCISARHFRLCSVKPGTPIGNDVSRTGWFFMKDLVSKEVTKSR